MEDGTAGGLPTKEEDEFRPFVRRLPEFKFWYSTTKAISIGFVCSWFEVFNLPVFWPVLVVYWLILFGLTSEYSRSRQGGMGTRRLTRDSATTNSAHDQVPLRSLHSRQAAVLREISLVRTPIAHLLSHRRTYDFARSQLDSHHLGARTCTS